MVLCAEVDLSLTNRESYNLVYMSREKNPANQKTIMASNHDARTVLQHLLQRCANTLLSMVNQLENNNVTSRPALQSSTTTTPIASTTPISNSLVSPTAVVSTTSTQQQFRPVAQNEFARLFQGGGQTRQRGRSSRNGRRAKPYCRQVHLNLICLSSAESVNVPDAETKMNLVLAGLGEKRVTFNLNKSYQHFDEILKGSYEKLADTGGYEILRTERNSKELHLLPVPPEGYNSEYLKSILGQAKGYIRPLQKDINIGMEDSCVSK